jgi:hypothetical protein
MFNNLILILIAIWTLHIIQYIASYNCHRYTVKNFANRQSAIDWIESNFDPDSYSYQFHFDQLPALSQPTVIATIDETGMVHGYRDDPLSYQEFTQVRNRHRSNSNLKQFQTAKT